MSLGDMFPQSFREDFASRNIDIGSAILILIDDIKDKPKYIIIASECDDMLAYVIINSDINPNVFRNTYLQSLNILIDLENHSFLDYDSYVDCSNLRELDKQETLNFLLQNPERAVGNVSNKVLRDIHATLTMAKTIPRNLKVKFGFNKSIVSK